MKQFFLILSGLALLTGCSSKNDSVEGPVQSRIRIARASPVLRGSISTPGTASGSRSSNPVLTTVKIRLCVSTVRSSFRTTCSGTTIRVKIKSYGLLSLPSGRSSGELHRSCRPEARRRSRSLGPAGSDSDGRRTEPNGREYGIHPPAHQNRDRYYEQLRQYDRGSHPEGQPLHGDRRSSAKSVQVDASSAETDIYPFPTVTAGRYEAILVPQRAALELEIQTSDGNRHTKTFQATDLQSGAEYAIEAVISNTNKIHASISGAVKGWEDGGAIAPVEDDLPEDSDLLEYAGVKYRIRQLSNGTTWMAENLRYIPEDKRVSSSPSEENGIWYPCTTSFTASSDTEYIQRQGLLYDLATAVGEPVTADNFRNIEGVRHLSGRMAPSDPGGSGVAYRHEQ